VTVTERNAESRQGERTALMEREPEAHEYQKPEVVDYGTLVELTAGMGHGPHEDGMHKSHFHPPHHHHHHPSVPHR
jgi:hypothetical protein